ncbi:hypothetical protein CR513_06813, partial [Mucuna pruriens]
MSFGLTNSSSTFMRLMNHVLRSLIGKCVIVYFNNILVYSTCINGHVMHVKKLLELLKNESLYVNIEKFMFYTNEVVSLGFVVCSYEVKVDEEKVKVIQKRVFQALQDRLTHAPILALPILTNLLSWNCGSKGYVVARRAPHSLLVKNLKELYALVKALQVWQHYLLTKEFHKQGKVNVVVDALFRRYNLLALLETKLLGFEYLKELYLVDDNFNETCELCANLAVDGGFFRHYGFLFKDKRFCVPKTSIRELLVIKALKGSLMGHFGEHKIFETLSEHFYCPHKRRDVHHICKRCLICRIAKSKVSSHGLYTPFFVPTFPWVDISMDFVLGLPRFSKISHFIPCHKVDDACHVGNLFFREVVRLHGLLKTIVSNRDSKFLRTFGVSLEPSYSFLLLVIHKRMDKLKWVVSSTTSHSPFELVYGFNLLTPLDLLPLLDAVSWLNKDGLSKAQFLNKLHERAKVYIEKKRD